MIGPVPHTPSGSVAGYRRWDAFQKSLLIDLYHRYALDGRDSCSYGGLLWCLELFDRLSLRLTEHNTLPSATIASADMETLGFKMDGFSLGRSGSSRCGTDRSNWTSQRRIATWGARVDLTSGHQTSVAACVLDNEALLPICRSTYSRIMATLPGKVSAAQLVIAEALRQAGLILDEDNEELIARLRTILAVLADGRNVQRLLSGEWVVFRDYG